MFHTIVTVQAEPLDLRRDAIISGCKNKDLGVRLFGPNWSDLYDIFTHNIVIYLKALIYQYWIAYGGATRFRTGFVQSLVASDFRGAMVTGDTVPPQTALRLVWGY